MYGGIPSSSSAIAARLSVAAMKTNEITLTPIPARGGVPIVQTCPTETISMIPVKWTKDMGGALISSDAGRLGHPTPEPDRRVISSASPTIPPSHSQVACQQAISNAHTLPGAHLSNSDID